MVITAILSNNLSFAIKMPDSQMQCQKPTQFQHPSAFASTHRKMSKPDQSPRQDLTNPLPSDAVSKVHLNTRDVMMECRFLCCLLLAIPLACHSESAIPIGVGLRTVCKGSVHSLYPFVTDQIHRRHFFTRKFSTTFYQRDCPQVLPFVARFFCLSGRLCLLTDCVTNLTFPFFRSSYLKFPVHFPKI